VLASPTEGARPSPFFKAHGGSNPTLHFARSKTLSKELLAKYFRSCFDNPATNGKAVACVTVASKGRNGPFREAPKHLFEEVIMKASLSGVFALVSALSIICIPEVFGQQGMPAFSDVDRIFEARCIKCHGGTRPAQGLHLDSYSGVMTGSKDMQVIVKGEPGKSELVKRIKGISKPRMPKDGPPWLPEREITLIEKWIAAGAPQ